MEDTFLAKENGDTAAATVHLLVGAVVLDPILVMLMQLMANAPANMDMEARNVTNV